MPAHILLCVLAYYGEWRLRRAWALLLLEQPSVSAQRKKRSQKTADGLPVYSFASLLRELASRARATYALRPQKTGQNEFDIPADARADAGAGPRPRLDLHVPSNRKVNSVLSLRESAEYSFEPMELRIN